MASWSEINRLCFHPPHVALSTAPLWHFILRLSQMLQRKHTLMKSAGKLSVSGTVSNRRKCFYCLWLESNISSHRCSSLPFSSAQARILLAGPGDWDDTSAPCWTQIHTYKYCIFQMTFSFQASDIFLSWSKNPSQLPEQASNEASVTSRTKAVSADLSIGSNWVKDM